MKKKFVKQVGAAMLAAVIAAGSTMGASACTGMYIGSEKTETGSTFVGRSEDIGKLYDKVFDVHPAADYAEGTMYEDTYGFSMPMPSHTYRYTVMRDSYKQGETMKDENGNYIGEAYGEAGVNENGVAVSATVSTYTYGTPTAKADPFVGTGICEISLNSVILQEATSAKHGVEIIGAIVEKYGAGESNSFTISDANEVWDVEIVSGHQYIAYKMPADKVSVNPNLLIMREMDIADTENVIASKDIIKTAQDAGTLVSSQLDEEGNPTVDEITKIDIAMSYGEDIGYSNSRYWQGVEYVNPDATEEEHLVGDMLLDTDKTFSTYEALRLLGYRGEGTEMEGKYSIGNDNQAECHVFEIKNDMPEALSIIQWQTMSRAEFSVYLPFYSNLITDTSDIFKTEYVKPKGTKNIEDFIDNEDFPIETSAYWVFAALNDLCDNNRELYGKNVKLFWEGYQKKLIEQQEDVDKAMAKIYAYNPTLAQEKATALGKAVSEEAFEYAKSILKELMTFINEHEGDGTEFVPSVLTAGVEPTYSIDMVGGTGMKDVKLKKVYNNGAVATWNSKDNAVKYEVFCNGEKVGETTESYFEISELEAGEEYTVSVYAVDEDGKTTVSAATFTTTNNKGHENAKNVGKGQKK